jgi:hypothetical protein
MLSERSQMKDHIPYDLMHIKVQNRKIYGDGESGLVVAEGWEAGEGNS